MPLVLIGKIGSFRWQEDVDVPDAANHHVDAPDKALMGELSRAVGPVIAHEIPCGKAFVRRESCFAAFLQFLESFFRKIHLAIVGLPERGSRTPRQDRAAAHEKHASGSAGMARPSVAGSLRMITRSCPGWACSRAGARGCSSTRWGIRRGWWLVAQEDSALDVGVPQAARSQTNVHARRRGARLSQTRHALSSRPRGRCRQVPAPRRGEGARPR